MKYKSKFRKNGIFRKYAFLSTILFFSGFLMASLHAQEVIITGTVTAASDGMPLPGVSIVDVNEPTTGVNTDFDGNYSLTVSDGNTSLRFSYIGFTSTVIAVNNQSTINVAMQEDVASLDEVVVVGYGTQKKATRPCTDKITGH